MYTGRLLFFIVAQFVKNTVTSHKRLILGCILVVLLAGYTVYFVFAILYNVEWATALIVFTALAVVGLLYMFIRDHYGDFISRKLLAPLKKLTEKIEPYMKWYVVNSGVTLV